MRDIPTHPRYTSANRRGDRKLKPAGEHWGHPLAVTGPVRAPGDRVIEAPKRPCANCGKRFQPTVKRSMLCEPCFRHTGGTYG